MLPDLRFDWNIFLVSKIIRNDDFNVDFYFLYFCFSCFIALWNSLIKAETQDHKAFDVIYSHSLFFTGIMQMLATIVITNFAQNEDGIIEDYGMLMRLFGAILISASIPVVALPMLNIKCSKDSTSKV